MLTEMTAVTEERVTTEIVWLNENGRDSTAVMLLGLWNDLNEARKTDGRSGLGRPVKYHWETLSVGETAFYENVNRKSLLASACSWSRRYCPSAKFSSAKECGGGRITRVA